MNKYLLEIGVEELPHKFIPDAAAQLKTLFKNLFDENNLMFNNIKTFATPRRLAVIIEGLQEKQQDFTKEIRGPISKIAYTQDGTLTPAALGFAKKNGVEPSSLFLKDDYLWAKIEVKGKSAKEIIQNSAEALVLKLQGAHFMRWADLEIKFSRPIRWVVSLFNDEELKINIAGVESSRISRGHRFACKKEIEIKSTDSYENDLSDVNVIADSQKRKDLIVKLASERAGKIGAEVEFQSELLDEVTYITEFPLAVLCEFDAEYLKIPEIVITTVMASHQRYFPLYKDGKLLNKFITMANFTKSEHPNIKRGNERVIKARLDDAIFFYNEDTKKPLADRVEALKGMNFQRNLGSMYDKVQRISSLSSFIAKTLNVDDGDILRTAFLCKADLTTSLVFEFTELQGFIGSDYALISEEKPNVALGIKEHYFPLSATGETPCSIEGIVVSIADKADTIAAVFKDGKKPTGSADPLGVRRAVLGILKTVLNNSLTLDLTAVISKASQLVDADVAKDMENFFISRLITMLSETYRSDILEACASLNPLKNLADYIARVEATDRFVKKVEFAKLYEGINRIIRITKDVPLKPVDEKLLTIQQEKELYNFVTNIKTEPAKYDILLTDLLMSVPYIQNFFDNVLVMDKEEQIKENRLALLNSVKAKFEQICDFSKIVY